MESKFSFEDQRPDEEVIFVQKRHPWVLSKPGFIGIAIILALVISFLFFGFSRATSYLIFGVVFFFILYGLYLWFLYNNYLYILTNQRLIIIEQNGLFSRKITESELDKIQNITIEVKGFMRTLLNFGDIKITTAGVDPVMFLLNVESPYEVQQKIVKYCKKIDLRSESPVIR